MKKEEHAFVGHDALLDDLKALGIQQGTELLVHSSLSSIGHVEGGANGVIEALLAALDPARGTLLVPTISGQESDGPEYPPCFDVRHTPCWTGKIAQTLWQREDAMRSLGPTHSVAAIGANAVSLTTGHEDCYTPCGYGSPYYRLARRNGHILQLGTTLACNTSLHTCEEVAGCNYVLHDRPGLCTIIDSEGHTLQRLSMIHKWHAPRRFDVLHDEYLKRGIMREGVIGRAKSYLIAAGPALEYTVRLLGKQPYYLVEQEWLRGNPL